MSEPTKKKASQKKADGTAPAKKSATKKKDAADKPKKKKSTSTVKPPKTTDKVVNKTKKSAAGKTPAVETTPPAHPENPPESALPTSMTTMSSNPRAVSPLPLQSLPGPSLPLPLPKSAKEEGLTSSDTTEKSTGGTQPPTPAVSVGQSNPDPAPTPPKLSEGAAPIRHVSSRAIIPPTIATSKNSGPTSRSAPKMAKAVSSPKLSAPGRPRNLQALPGGTPSKATSSRNVHMHQAKAMDSSRFGGMKTLGKNAISNRNLPPPPGSRSLFTRSSSHRKQTVAHRPSVSSDDDDDMGGDSDDEFGHDAAPTKRRIPDGRTAAGHQHLQQTKAMNSSRFGGVKTLGKNAISNRNLPPPPGSRSIFSKSSSHHKLPVAYRPPVSSDDDDMDADSDEEFGQEVAHESDGNDARQNNSILRKTNLRATGAKRINADGSITSGLLNITMHSVDEDEELLDPDPEMVPLSGPPATPPPRRPGLELRDSEHSMRGWTESFRWGGKQPTGTSSPLDRRATLSDDYAAKNRSTRSVLTVDMEYVEEPMWKQTLRYLRILAPHQDEKPIKRKIRILMWVCLFLDFLTGLVSIVTYDHVTMCCGKPILSIAGDINWNVAIQVTVYLYMALIFVEIVPVMRDAFPLNLLNPFVGFLITFAMFFDDRITIAAIMWVIEFVTVMCELAVYRLKLKWHAHREARLNKAEVELLAIRKERRRRKLSNSTHSLDSEITLDDGSFHDESEMMKSTGIFAEAEARPVDISQIRETRLLRERRLLRQAQKEDTIHLRYHFGGVVFNVGLVCISLLMITMIGRSGGLCIVDMETPNIFTRKQLENCFQCQDSDGTCERCNEDGDGGSHCYYPYY